jgi:hypothetical protein
MPYLLSACDYHCCDILDKVAPVEGVSIEDLRGAIWTYRSGVNVRRAPRSDAPSWWKKFEAQLDAASVGYWRPFTLPVGKAQSSDDAPAKTSSRAAAVEGKDTVSGVQPIKSFFSNVTAAEAEAAAAAAANDLLHEKVQGKELSTAPTAVNLPSIKSFFSNISEGEAEKATAAALAAAAASMATVASAVKRGRSAAAAAPLGIKKFFVAGGSGGASNGGDEDRIIIIDD